MTGLLNGLLAAPVSGFVAEFFPVLRIILLVLTILCCIAVIVLALLSPAGSENGNVVTGSTQSETFYSKNKSHMNEGLIKKLMIGFSIATAVLIVLFYITIIIYRGY